MDPHRTPGTDRPVQDCLIQDETSVRNEPRPDDLRREFGGVHRRTGGRHVPKYLGRCNSDQGRLYVVQSVRSAHPRSGHVEDERIRRATLNRYSRTDQVDVVDADHIKTTVTGERHRGSQIPDVLCACQPRSTLRRIPAIAASTARTTSLAQILVLNAVTRGEFDIVVYGDVRARWRRVLHNISVDCQLLDQARCAAAEPNVALDQGARSREVDVGGANWTVEHQDSELTESTKTADRRRVRSRTD